VLANVRQLHSSYSLAQAAAGRALFDTAVMDRSASAGGGGSGGGASAALLERTQVPGMWQSTLAASICRPASAVTRRSCCSLCQLPCMRWLLQLHMPTLNLRGQPHTESCLRHALLHITALPCGGAARVAAMPGRCQSAAAAGLPAGPACRWVRHTLLTRAFHRCRVADAMHPYWYILSRHVSRQPSPCGLPCKASGTAEAHTPQVLACSPADTRI
jgi:hypothetical protein